MAKYDLSQIKRYNYWGQTNEPPPRLKTKRQLSEIGLRPLNPVGVIVTNKYDCLLFDCEDPTSAIEKRKSTEKQLLTLAQNREKQALIREHRYWNKYSLPFEQDRVEAVTWARSIRSNPDVITVDTETTGLDYDDEIVEIAICNLQRQPLFQSLVKPTKEVSIGALSVHGISQELLTDAPTFQEIYEEIRTIFKDRIILGWNIYFDLGRISYSCSLCQQEMLISEDLICDVMKIYARWFGDYSDYHKSYRWQALNGGHRAMADCLAVVDRIEAMAVDSVEIIYPEWFDRDLFSRKLSDD
jgi:DNA polymerase III subunit epsilon